MDKIMIGWQEWCSFPQLNILAIKAKVDTGATTSSLHALNIEPFIQNHESMVRFDVQPLQYRHDIILQCAAPLIDKRIVTDSGGHKEERYVIRSLAKLGEYSWEIDVTLADRVTMKYRMLLGRTALAGRFMIDPLASTLLGRLSKKKLQTYYPH
jgi:ribosomal protein S6--L-glutamate ligase